MTSRTSMAQREERIRRTVYVSDIDLQVEMLNCFFFLRTSTYRLSFMLFT